MKRIITLLLASCILLCFCSCGKKDRVDSYVPASSSNNGLPQDSEQLDFSSMVTVVSTPEVVQTQAPVLTPEPTVAPIYTPEPTTSPITNPVVTPIPTTAVTTVNTGYVTITKSPLGETVKPYGEAKFTAYAENYNTIEWLIAKGETVYVIQDAPAHFSGLQVSGQGTNLLTLTNIPPDMDGWEVQTKFIGSNDTKWTARAKITVSGSSTAPGGTGIPNSDSEKLVLTKATACLDGITTYGRTLGYSVGGFENYSYANGKADFNITVTGNSYTIVGEFIATESSYYPIYANVFSTSSTPTPLTFQNCSMTDFYTVLSNPANYVK